MSVRVRALEAGDHAALAALRSQARTETSAKKGGQVLLEDVPADVPGGTPEAGAATGAGDHGDHAAGISVLVGEIVPRDGATAGPPGILGYAVLRGSGAGRAELEELYVAPGARTVGLGTALLGAATEQAARWGCNRIDSVALPGDRATKNFFEAHGMVARAITVSRAVSRLQGQGPGEADAHHDGA